jgi:hypothetical protein
MHELIQQLERELVFEMMWRIPFQKEDKASIQYVAEYIRDIIGCDCWAVGNADKKAYFSFYDLKDKTDEVREWERRSNLLEDVSPLLDNPEKVYLVMGGNPFRYLTIEYTPKGLGILTDYQRPE